MPSQEIVRLLTGFKRFRTRYFDSESALFRKLQSGQSPKTLVIACSDSRVDPALMADAAPGELFVVRNVANLVPPFEKNGGYHGVSAAIEFAVTSLKVENILVLGHRQCGGIRALMTNENMADASFVGQWVQIAKAAREKVLQMMARDSELAENVELQCRHCEMESITVSLENLKSFPFVKKALDSKKLELHGVYFDLESGELYEFDHDLGRFTSVVLESI